MKSPTEKASRGAKHLYPFHKNAAKMDESLAAILLSITKINPNGRENEPTSHWNHRYDTEDIIHYYKLIQAVRHTQADAFEKNYLVGPRQKNMGNTVGNKRLLIKWIVPNQVLQDRL